MLKIRALRIPLGHTIFAHLAASISKLLGVFRNAVATFALLIYLAILSIQSLMLHLYEIFLDFNDIEHRTTKEGKAAKKA